jgi:deoxycytidine triphosphate deaminase
MLSDQDISAEIFDDQGGKKLVAEFPEFDFTKWDELGRYDTSWSRANSPIQPSSIDLHVGYIYVPGAKTGDLGSETRGASSHSIGPGESVIVSTHERLTLPPGLGGIVFPPSRLSSKGILVANIGHIDPGFSGHLRFTIINMGAKHVPLERAKDAVGTLLLFALKTPSKNSWLGRQGSTPKGEPTRDELDALSKDFGNIDARIVDVTHRTVRRLRNSYSLWAFLWPIVLGLAVGVATIFFATGQFLLTRMDANQQMLADVRERMAQSSADVSTQRADVLVELTKMRAELDATRREVSELRSQSIAKSRAAQINK